MARPIRIEFSGAVYHVTARGNERRRIFRGDTDRELFLETLGQTVALHDLTVHAYCLMPNHYHLVVETARGNLSRALGWLQTTYTIRFNRRYRRSGHLFQGRFKAHLVEADADAQGLLRYVHLNPVRGRDKQAPVAAERWGALNEFAWSSHRAYAGLADPRPWLSLGWLAWFGAEGVSFRIGNLAFLRRCECSLRRGCRRKARATARSRLRAHDEFHLPLETHGVTERLQAHVRVLQPAEVHPLATGTGRQFIAKQHRRTHGSRLRRD